MALTGTGNALGAAMKNAVDALSEADKRNRLKVFEAMGTAIIAHFIANGAGAITVAVTSVSGVTTGGSASGPGTGTGTIT